jgi:hypothetical protein
MTSSNQSHKSYRKYKSENSGTGTSEILNISEIAECHCVMNKGEILATGNTMYRTLYWWEIHVEY